MLRLELALHPDDAARLSRLRSIAARRASRTRSRRLRMVWHDTPDAALEHQGLALLERSHGLRLERMRPNGTLWVPGTPPPIVADPPSPEALPGPLLPWAALDGQTSTLTLTGDAGPVTLSLLRGTIKSVKTDRAACRMQLEGPSAEVLPLAAELAVELRASVSPTVLSAEALSLARNTPAEARRLGAPELRPGMTVAEALTEVIAHLTDVVLHHASHVGLEAPEAVHQARVAMRRMRSALSLFRRAANGPSVTTVNAGLKALGTALGPARDWDVFIRGLGAEVGEVFAEDPAVRRLLRTAEERRRAAYAALSVYLQSPAYRRLGVECVALAAGSGLADPADEAASAALDDKLEPFAAAALERRDAGLRDIGAAIEDMPPAALHEVRLQGKRLRYAAEFFAPLWGGKAARRYVRRLAVLQEQLGVLNDASVAAELLASLPGGPGHASAAGVVRGFAAAGLRRHRPRIMEAWEEFNQASVFWA
jgi:triphosphatase